jgi:membrane protein DedA with SNARE-associated domain
MLSELVQWLLSTIFDWGYIGVFLLMAVESSLLPVPSELVLIPAGVLIAQGKMNLELVFVASVLGSVFGAFVNYYLAMLVGRSFLERYGKYFFVSQLSLDKMDDFFENHGHISTFTGRLVPGVRHLISIPAGISKMNLKIFLVYTGLGAAIWSVILIALGYFLGANEELITTYLHQIIIGLIVSLIVMIGGYVYFKKKR